MATTAPFLPMVCSPAFVDVRAQDDSRVLDGQLGEVIDRFGPPLMKISENLVGFRHKLGVRILEQYGQARMLLPPRSDRKRQDLHDVEQLAWPCCKAKQRDGSGSSNVICKIGRILRICQNGPGLNSLLGQWRFSLDCKGGVVVTPSHIEMELLLAFQASLELASWRSS